MPAYELDNRTGDWVPSTYNPDTIGTQKDAYTGAIIEHSPKDIVLLVVGVTAIFGGPACCVATAAIIGSNLAR